MSSAKETYSFDDITSVIVGRGTIDDYFNYNLETANFFKQGNIEIMKDKKWVILSEGYISDLIGRSENSIPTLQNLPSNIASIKQKPFFSK